MKLPTVRGRTTHHPKKALCPWCQKNKVLEPHSFAMLGGGALLMNRKDKSGGPDDDLDGFLYIAFHGAHEGGLGKDKGIGAMVELASGVRGGQFDLYFCSTKCLRGYLNFCVDELEEQIRKERDKSNKSHKRVAQIKAVKMVRKIRDQHYEETKGLSVAEQIKYVKRKSEKLQRNLKPQ